MVEEDVDCVLNFEDEKMEPVTLPLLKVCCFVDYTFSILIG